MQAALEASTNLTTERVEPAVIVSKVCEML